MLIGHFEFAFNSLALFLQQYYINPTSFCILQANCVDSTAAPEAVFAGEVSKLKEEKIKPQEQLTLEPYERDHAVVVGQYRLVVHKESC